ncbi:MAG: hypothetical protein GW893_07130 [Armatimonadetes bacterium]|nr:hypothetical protein [Armatimonadota bacterium]PIU67348.1 MAG: hypothetical protein COS85_01070 [Armatimonadetes bacterium CG07_land_8_20_14_0_80_59_28]PIX44744.1 MAG: hypothetical protein COZ56_03865 [Armatimonadetes bacterium CG_4_8_14_3_um_filter_58_9]PIY42193.1 MAG: hypothetical protein COZ05_14355 [Armatimonadetes bacterium CG_4_10_14_3_um_filter_59_10]PJB77896.1 MAG: hypothetical protein CO095_01105 [Armatimonadetes bacterium CG_4_9_14_3_um_filter_58_7]
MKAVAVRAHFDGATIQLDEPFRLERDTPLLVTVLPRRTSSHDERAAWLSFSRRGLENAYGEDEPEYTLNMIKEANPEYARR